MNRRSLIVGAAALACASVTPALSAECDVDNAMDLMRMISSDMGATGLTPLEALDLSKEYLTYCKETYPGFDYRVTHDGLGYSVYMHEPDALGKFHVITLRWDNGLVTATEVVGELPNG